MTKENGYKDVWLRDLGIKGSLWQRFLERIGFPQGPDAWYWNWP